MKNSSIIKAGIVAFLLSLLRPLSAQASPTVLVYPLNADTVWYIASTTGSASTILGLNTAMIDYNNSTLGNGALMVSDYFGNGTAGGVEFRDQPSGYEVHVAYEDALGPVPDFYMFSSPHIIVGNDSLDPFNTYRVAVAYICYNQLTFTIQPQIDYWKVVYEGPGNFTVYYLNSASFSIAQTGTVHIDIISEAGNTSATGYPWCNKFIFTCDGADGIVAYYDSLNYPATGTVTGTTIVSSGSGASQPDVAAIQRKVGSPAVIDNLGLFTYTDAGGLEYIEWNASSPATGGGVTLDGTGIYSLYYPRIDAPDDYTINAPSAVRSYYKVVAEGVIGTTSTSNSYDNLTTSGVPFLTYPGSPNEYAPTVASGGSGDSQYVVAHSSNDNSLASASPIAYPKWNTFMEPIDWSNPAAIAPAPSSAPDYFLVNYTPFDPSTDHAGGYYLTAISTPCNNPSDQTLVAWAFTDVTISHNSTVWFKTSRYTTGSSSNGYAFRQAAPVGNTPPVDWNIYPNPAATALTVNSPVADARFEVTDMPGRTVLSGSLQAGTQIIDVSALSLGSYIMSLYEGNNRDYTKVIVKQ